MHEIIEKPALVKPKKRILAQREKDKVTKDELKEKIRQKKEYYLKILLSQSDEPIERRKIMRKKQLLFKNIVKDIANKYENINK